MAESSVSQALVWSNDNLFAKPEPAYTFAKSVLDSDADNKMYYKSICLRNDVTLVETFNGVTICWHGVSQRDVDLVQFNGLFAVVDHLAERVEFVLAYDLCSKLNTIVVGGFSKLLSQVPLRPLSTWSDNRFSGGKVYESLGFKHDSDLAPDYEYVKGSQRFSKQSMRKNLEEKISGEN